MRTPSTPTLPTSPVQNAPPAPVAPDPSQTRNAPGTPFNRGLGPIPERDGRAPPPRVTYQNRPQPIPTPQVQREFRGQHGRHWGRDYDRGYGRYWSHGGYPYWYFRSYDYPLDYGYFPYPYSSWNGGYRYDTRYPVFQFYLSPGLRIGLPPFGFGVYYDLYWRPTDRTYIYEQQTITTTHRPVSAGLRIDANEGVVRVAWADPAGRIPRKVNLFIADRGQTVLATQALTRPPYSALFEPTPDAAFVGVSVEWANGSVSTAMLPYSS